MWPVGDHLFGAASKSAPVARALLALPKGQPCSHIFCTIPGLPRQYCAQFQPTSPTQWINIKLWPVSSQESFSLLMLHSHPYLTCWADRWHGCPSDNYQTLCANFWHAALSSRYHQIPAQTAGELRWGKYILPIKNSILYKMFRRTKLQIS
jgi:hypothetical protein